jgi:hypothetical protein
VRWQSGTPVQAATRLVHQVCTPVEMSKAVAWQDATQQAVSLLAPHQVAHGMQVAPVLRLQQGQTLARTLLAPHQAATPAQRALVARWQQARDIPAGLSVYVPPGGEDGEGREISLDMVFACPAYAGGPINMVFGRVCGAVEPGGPPALVVVPIRSLYMTLNTILLRRVAGNIELPATGFQMSIDADSWTWNWSANVQGRALELLAPEAGEPVELEAIINGVAYRLASEDVGRQRRFGRSELAVSGRGLAAELDAPYALTQNFSNAADRTAQQLAIEALMVNGVGIGWSVDWGLTDWLVPAGAWSHQGSHMSAVNAIAAAAGGYVQPHRTARTLRVLPRYPSAPWDWASVTPDFELPSAPVVVEGIKWLTRPAYNRVHVSGEAVGVLGEVTRGGTAGDVSAPMVVDPLITHADAARQRGLSILGNTGGQAIVSLSLPVLAETGLILPGQFVRYVDGATDRMGLVRGSSLDWDRPKLRQTLTLETHV